MRNKYIYILIMGIIVSAVLFKQSIRVSAAENEESLLKVSISNYRQIKLEFTEKIQVNSINEANIYINMLDDITGDIFNTSLKSFCKGEEFTIVSNEDKYGKIIDIKTKQHKFTELGFDEEVRYTINLRNVKDSNGDYLNTTNSSFIFEDEEKPYIKNITVVDKVLRLTFNEPVMQYEYEGCNFSGFMIYIDGLKVLAKDTSGLKPLSLLEEQSILDIQLYNYIYENKESYKIEVVGGKDLAGNLQKEGILKQEFKIEETQKPVQAIITPEVKNIEQVEDNVLKISFNTKNVYPISDEHIVLTLQYGIFRDNYNGQRVGAFEDLNVKGKDVEVNDGYWIVRINASKYKENGAFSFYEQSIMIRDVTVKNYKYIPDTGFESSLSYGKSTIRTLMFTRDTKAPIIDEQKLKSEKMYEIDKGLLKIPFYDDPFNGNIQKGKAGYVTVSITTAYGIIKDVILDIYDQRIKVDDSSKSIIIDLKQTELTDDKYYLYENYVYTVSFQQGIIADKSDYLGKQFDINYISEKSASIPVGKLEIENVEGEVPQTTKSFIQSGRDLQLGIGGHVSNIDNEPYKVGTNAWLRNNPRAIIVRFYGEASVQSSLDKANYSIGEKNISENSTIEYYEEDIDSSTEGNERFVVIYLSANSIDSTGTYNFKVKGITNNKGKLMLPVTDTVSLVDNTGPALKSYSIIGDRTIELTFDEPVQFAGKDIYYSLKAANNFKITVGGYEYTASNVYLSGNTAVLYLSNFIEDLSLRVSISVIEDYNGEINLTDKEGNYILSNK